MRLIHIRNHPRAVLLWDTRRIIWTSKLSEYRGMKGSKLITLGCSGGLSMAWLIWKLTLVWNISKRNSVKCEVRAIIMLLFASPSSLTWLQGAKLFMWQWYESNGHHIRTNVHDDQRYRGEDLSFQMMRKIYEIRTTFPTFTWNNYRI